MADESEAGATPDTEAGATPDTEAGATPDTEAGATEATESGLVVVQQDDDDPEQSEIDRPDKLLRLAGTVQGLLKEVHATELDNAGRQRLATVHRTVVEELSSVVSDDLVDELATLDMGGLADEPTGGELRVAQAQLAGWLEGLFHGIRASVASQQQQQQAALLQQRAQAQQGRGDGTPGGTGQYL